MMDYQIPKWKRLTLPPDIFTQTSMTKIHVELPETFSYQTSFDVERFPIRKGLDPVFTDVLSHEGKNALTVVMERSSDDEVGYIRVDVDKDMIENIHIQGNEGARGTLIIDYVQEDERAINLHQWLQIDAKAAADISIVIVQRLGQTSRHFSQQVARVDEQARVNISSIELGGEIQVLAMESVLNGRHAHTSMNLGYFADGNVQGDYGNTVIHNNKMTTSTILAKGVLKDNAKKVYRGNLFFERGSSQSVGKEEEFTILLNEGIRADSIPALLCDEDDVIGEHAASAGQLDRDKLFYIMSRGYTEKEAKKLIVMASFSELFQQLPKPLKEELSEWVARRIDDER